jgi:acetyl-CoA carboxylase biotin carboxyl carrier protein
MSSDDRESGLDPQVLESTAETVRMLAGVMAENGITLIEIEAGGFQIKLKAGKKETVVGSAPQSAQATGTTPSSEAATPAAPEATPGYIVTSPMIGTFYTAPSPGDPVFVKVGDRVEVGQTIGIIEAMKIMNEIAADRAGVVDDVLVENGQAVEYGSPLLRIVLG